MPRSNPTPPEARGSLFAWFAQMGRLRPRMVSGLLLFSLAVNLLLLVSPLYMLQIYDRVLSSGSTDTLIWLTVIALGLLAVYAAAEAGRRRLAGFVGEQIEDALAVRAFKKFEESADAADALPRDLANATKAQSLFQSGTVLAFFDLPFSPFFIGALFLIHPLLGVLSLAGGAVVLVVACLSEWMTRRPGGLASAANGAAGRLAHGLARQRSALVAMGLVPRAYEKWRAEKSVANAHATRASRGDSFFTAVSRALRQMLQIVILGAGAALALSQQLSPGGIVAASIIMSRALAPIDLIVGSWRSLVQAREAWAEVYPRLSVIDTETEFTPLPTPDTSLAIDRLAVVAPGGETPLVRPFSLDLGAGTMVALLGANGAGKTTLLQTLAGAWPAASGSAALGGRSIHAWPSRDRGRHVGYLPQDVELFPATVAENVSRFCEADPDALFDAARRAGAHELVLTLPDGYDTAIGPGGLHLSAGQRQLIGLARAFYGRPALLLLDEPTANLDAEAAASLAAQLRADAHAGALQIISTHDPHLVQLADIALTIRQGSIMATPVKRVDAVAQPTLVKEAAR